MNNGIGGIRMVGNEEKKGEKVEEKEVIEVVEEPNKSSLAIFRQSDEAIVMAGQMLEGFESLYEDDERRAQATGSSGVVVGGILNYALDAAEEKNPDVKSELKQRALTTGLEFLTGFIKTGIYGENRRKVRRGGARKLIKK